MKYIKLSRGKRTMVDDDDYAYLTQWAWYANRSVMKTIRTIWYAYRQYRDPNKKNAKGQAKQVSVAMHRVIMNAPRDTQVDHINGDGLDNRKQNLRLCTPAQNLWNSRWLATPNKPYKGVHKDHSLKHPGWRATIGYGNKTIHLGWFKSAKVAAKAYDNLAKALYGEFACLNFPEEKK